MGMKCDLKDIPGDLPAAEALLDLMLQDKKVLDGTLRLILAKGIGQAFLTSDVPKSALLGLLKDALANRAA
jgi:3-dehydroquinate synthase